MTSDGHVLTGRTWRSALIVLMAVLLSLGMTGESSAGAGRLGSHDVPAGSAAIPVPAGSADAHAVLRPASCPSGALDRDPGRWWIPAVLTDTWHGERPGWVQVRSRPAITAGDSRVVRTCQERAPPWAGSVS